MIDKLRGRFEVEPKEAKRAAYALLALLTAHRRLSAFGSPKSKRSRTPCGPEALLLAKTAGQTDI
jgi:hypothetical protein